MPTSSGIEIIALEEHYWDKVVTDTFVGRNASRRGPLLDRLYDVGELRLKEMDAAGIDIQVLSHGAPSAQRLDAETGPGIARQANGQSACHGPRQSRPVCRFCRACHGAPGIGGGRAGTLCEGSGLQGGDDPRSDQWQVLRRQGILADLCPVPRRWTCRSTCIPAIRTRMSLRSITRIYLDDFPALATAGWGYTVETATQAIRMVLSGVFDAHPGLQMVLGHMGETLPFLLWRVNQALSRVENTQTRSFREIFEAHISRDHQRQFLEPGPAVHNSGNGCRQGNVLGLITRLSKMVPAPNGQNSCPSAAKTG